MCGLGRRGGEGRGCEGSGVLEEIEVKVLFYPLPQVEKFKYNLCANNHCGIICRHLYNV